MRLDSLLKTRIYVIGHKASGPCKIGMALHPRARLRELQCGNPLKLHVLYSARCPVPARKLERDLHKEFAASRMHGEWFDVEAKLVIAAIRRRFPRRPKVSFGGPLFMGRPLFDTPRRAPSTPLHDPLKRVLKPPSLKYLARRSAEAELIEKRRERNRVTARNPVSHATGFRP